MRSIQEILPGVLSDLQKPEKVKRNLLIHHWPAIAGCKVAPHTQPRLSENGELCIWVDQSSLAFELSRRHGSGLLKRVRALLGEENVKSIHFRVGQLRS